MNLRLLHARPIVAATPRARVLFPIALLFLTVGALSGPATVIGWSCWFACLVCCGAGMDWDSKLQQRKD